MSTAAEIYAKVTLKLLINKKTNKVIFAEAGKDFVDFLFSILSFPLGTVIRLLSEDQMVGCLGNLYKSCENLNNTFIQPSTTKDTILKPKLQQLCTNGGIVKGSSTYMVMDNLKVMPLSTISIVNLLNEFNVQWVVDLEEKIIELGKDEVTV
ncbi:hypothetical protein LINPERPRIM_LOCUS13549 [Linum perenne]